MEDFELIVPYACFSKYNKSYPLVFKTKPNIFSYNGKIWHHFYKFCNRCEIEKQERQWCLTTMSVYKKALKKAKNIIFYNKKIVNRYFPDLDDFEVFIEKLN